MKSLMQFIEDSNITISKLSSNLGLSENELIQKIKLGKDIDILTAYQISKELNVSLDYLYNLL